MGRSWVKAIETLLLFPFSLSLSFSLSRSVTLSSQHSITHTHNACTFVYSG